MLSLLQVKMASSRDRYKFFPYYDKDALAEIRNNSFIEEHEDWDSYWNIVLIDEEI